MNKNELEEERKLLLDKFTKLNTRTSVINKYLYKKEYIIHIIFAFILIFMLIFYSDKISINKFLQYIFDNKELFCVIMVLISGLGILHKLPYLLFDISAILWSFVMFSMGGIINIHPQYFPLSITIILIIISIINALYGLNILVNKDLQLQSEKIAEIEDKLELERIKEELETIKAKINTLNYK